MGPRFEHTDLLHAVGKTRRGNHLGDVRVRRATPATWHPRWGAATSVTTASELRLFQSSGESVELVVIARNGSRKERVTSLSPATSILRPVGRPMIVRLPFNA